MNSSGRAKDICRRLGKPSETNAKVLATLFPACASSTKNKKRKFDPKDECIVAGQHRCKQSASQSKGRSKQITVVLLSNIPSSIPKGAAHEQLKKKGKVREVPFQRYMSEEEVKEVLIEDFECLSYSEVQFLQSHKNNSLSIAMVQDLDGIGVIFLAGCGSLYLKVSLKEGSENHPASTSIGDITEHHLSTLIPALQLSHLTLLLLMFKL